MGDLAVAGRVDRLEADPPISIESVDLNMVDADRLRLEVGHVIRYFAIVEGQVAQNASDIAALLPRLHGHAALLPRLHGHERRFLAVWSAQEVAHGRVFDAIARQPQSDPPRAVGPSPPPRRIFEVVGRVTRIGWVHEVLKL
jgi:hypothetical protein